MTVIRSACRAGAWIAASSVLAMTLLSGPLDSLVPAAEVRLDMSDDGRTLPGPAPELPRCEGTTSTPAPGIAPSGIVYPPPGTVSVTIPELPGVNCLPVAPVTGPFG